MNAFFKFGRAALLRGLVLVFTMAFPLFAANPSFSSFNSNHFTTNGYIISIANTGVNTNLSNMASSFSIISTNLAIGTNMQLVLVPQSVAANFPGTVQRTNVMLVYAMGTNGGVQTGVWMFASRLESDGALGVSLDWDNSALAGGSKAILPSLLTNFFDEDGNFFGTLPGYHALTLGLHVNFQDSVSQGTFIAPDATNIQGSMMVGYGAANAVINSFGSLFILDSSSVTNDTGSIYIVPLGGASIAGLTSSNTVIGSSAMNDPNLPSSGISNNIVIGALQSLANNNITTNTLNIGGKITGLKMAVDGVNGLIGINTTNPPVELTVGGSAMITNVTTTFSITTTNGILSKKGNAAAPTSISVTASPFTFTAPAGPNIQVYIGGGIVSAISKNGTSIASGLTLTGMVTVNLQAGETVTVTYSSAPAMNYSFF